MSDTDKFLSGDEIEWNSGDKRVRARVITLNDELVAALYDETGQITDGTLPIPADALATSAPDRLAECVPNVYHLLPTRGVGESGPHVSYCGGIDKKGAHLQILDPNAFHHAANRHTRDAWSSLIDGAGVALDMTDRSLPLDERVLPDEALVEAKKESLCVECFAKAVRDKCWGEAPIHMEQEELRTFVRDWMDRRIFSHLHIENPKDVRSCFMILALTPPMPKDYIEKVGLIYEYLDKAGPRSINGMPNFLSMRLMHKDDWSRALKVIEKEEEHRAALESVEI